MLYLLAKISINIEEDEPSTVSRKRGSEWECQGKFASMVEPLNYSQSSVHGPSIYPFAGMNAFYSLHVLSKVISEGFVEEITTRPHKSCPYRQESHVIEFVKFFIVPCHSVVN